MLAFLPGRFCETVLTGLGEEIGDRLLADMKDVDGEAAGAFQRLEAA